jgi:hypothetical protein
VPVVDVYRLWRDLGYAMGALISGVIADLLGMRAAIQVVAGLTQTLLSEMQIAVRMREMLAAQPAKTSVSVQTRAANM